MNEQENVQVVQQHFVAFEQGDLKAALNAFAEDIDFQSPVTRTAPEEISWAKPRHSREEIATFFKELGEKIDTERMEILEFTAQGNRVIVEEGIVVP